jgi:hypothetical protein
MAGPATIAAKPKAMMAKTALLSRRRERDTERLP